MDKLIEKEVNIEDCVPYDTGYTGKKAEWRRKESPMYPKVKASVEKFGMINPLWLFERGDGKYRIGKGCCRAVVCYDLGIKKVKALIAPVGMERKVANRLFRNSEYKDAYFVGSDGEVVLENGKPKVIPKGF